LPSLRAQAKKSRNPRREKSRIASSLLHDSRRPRRPGPLQYPDQREWHLGKRWKLLAKSDGEFARNSDIDAGSVALRTSRYASFLLVARSDLSYAGRALSREPPAAVHAF